MKTMHPSFPYGRRNLRDNHGSKVLKSIDGADFQKILYWHLLSHFDSVIAVFAIDPFNDFRLIFGVESSFDTLKQNEPSATIKNISDNIQALTEFNLARIWHQIKKIGFVTFAADFIMGSGETKAVDVSFQVLNLMGREMMAGHVRNKSESCYLTDSCWHQLQDLIESIAKGVDKCGVFERIALFLESTKPGLYCSILILDEHRKRFQIAAAPSLSEFYRTELDALVALDRSGCNKDCIASALLGQRLIRADIDRQFCGNVCQQLKVEIGAKSCWSEPIFSSSNRLLGIIRVYLNHAAMPDENDLAWMRQAVHLSAIVIERETAAAKCSETAGGERSLAIGNRYLIDNRLREQAERCDRHGLSMAMLFVNLDHFKEINATLGFQSGDLLLTQAEQRIRGSVRDSDVVARLAGDEFVVIIPPHKGCLNAGMIGEHIVEALSQPFRLDESIAHISASVGVAYYPDDAEDIDQLLDCADQSMYAAKRAGRSGVSFFPTR